MKKVLLFILLILIMFPAISSAEESFTALDPYPYSSHILGEDLVIYGDTSFSKVVLGLFYPDDEQGYLGMAKFIITISADELREGYVIPTDTFSRLWPEGEWTVRIQNDMYFDEIKIPMTKEAKFDRIIKLATYEDDALVTLTSYQTRGVILKNNVFSFVTEDGTTVRIFSWNNFSPTNEGESRIFVSFSKDGYMTDIKTYHGFLSSYSDHICIIGENGDSFKLFYWNDNLQPIT